MQGAELVAAEVGGLVSLPEVATRILQVADDPASTAEDVARVILQDAALVARLLRAANSPALGMRGQVDTVSRAVVVLGVRQVRDLALGLCATRSFDGIPTALMDVDAFWHHSLLTALCASHLAQRVPRLRAESVFIAGLLHDVGQLLLCRARPQQEQAALLMTVDAPGEPDLHVCERELLGFDHADVGGALAQLWGLPVHLVECLAFHHRPQNAVAAPLEVAVVHVANSLAVLAEVGSGDWLDAPPVQAVAWQRTGLTAAGCLDIPPLALGDLADAKRLFGLQQ